MRTFLDSLPLIFRRLWRSWKRKMRSLRKEIRILIRSLMRRTCLRGRIKCLNRGWLRMRLRLISWDRSWKIVVKLRLLRDCNWRIRGWRSRSRTWKRSLLHLQHRVAMRKEVKAVMSWECWECSWEKPWRNCRRKMISMKMITYKS